MLQNKKLKSPKNESELSVPNRTWIQLDNEGKVLFSDQWASLSALSSHSKPYFPVVGSHFDSRHPVGVVDAGILLGEEEEISGTQGTLRGAGTIYFHGCQLRCTHCYQPEFYESEPNLFTTTDSIASVFIQFQKEGARTILIISSHFNRYALQAIQTAKKMGLTLPIVYKHSGVMTPAQIDLLTPWVDIFLPDTKAITLPFAQSQGLNFKIVSTSLQSLKHSIQTGKRVIARYLLIPTYNDHSRELRMLTDSLGSLARAPHFSISLLNLFFNPTTGMIERVSDSVLRECSETLRSQEVHAL